MSIYTHFIATGVSKSEDVSAINRLAFFESEEEAKEALAAYPANSTVEWFQNPRIVDESEAVAHVYGRNNFDVMRRNQHYFWNNETKKWMFF